MLNDANRDISQRIDSFDVEFCGESTASRIGHYSDTLGKSYGTRAQTLRSTGLAFPISSPLLEKQASGTQSQNAQDQKALTAGFGVWIELGS